ncbi:tetratricopeptide repeat protein [Deinococcus depolymerans]|uniref:Tetratricopeptide repeat protein n=1 Tax=Deinococcus depolymerans TaxID=392408 RepID=A0ABP3LFI7_9DEIO
MVPLPLRLLPRLDRASGVVAPVDAGANQSALLAWAAARGWTTQRTPPDPDQRNWLWCPERRADLAHLPPEQAGALVLSGADLLLDAADWRAALPQLSADQQEATLAYSGGWPAALPLAARLPDDPDPHLHPLATALLSPLLPPGPLLASAARLAVATLVTPTTAALLNVPRPDVDALHGGGWLWPERDGWTFPAPLRRLLAPHPDPHDARQAARALEDTHPDAALDTLARAGLWDEHLNLLARVARAGQGEGSLRAALRRLPEAWRAAPPALYLAGLLARAAHDPHNAEALYTRALSGPLSGPLSATVHNARGVVRALQGDTEAALRDFGRAAQGQGVTAGEAGYNRATLLVQLGQHAEAERSLQDAVAAFREAGDLPREAQSLETLGALHFGRGLLREALGPYRRALALFLPDHPHDAALTHLNLAECHVYLGELPHVERHLDEAVRLGEQHPSAQTLGWLRRVKALMALQAGEPAQALALLDRIQSDDRTLQAETALLRARAYREQGQLAAAHSALRGAGSLGLRADLEGALLGDDGYSGDQHSALDAVIAAARREEARLELVTALLHRANPDDLREALDLIRTHGYLSLLGSRAAAPLTNLAQDPATRALFPLRVQTLGPLRFTHAGRQVQLSDFPTRKSAALLVALALSEHPQPRETLAERFWPGAKNPLASLQTAVYHLRSTFGVPVVGTERGLLYLLFPVSSDLGELRRLLRSQDLKGLAELLRPLTAPLSVLPDLPVELGEERAEVERLLHDALRVHANAQPDTDIRRRDALRILIAADPMDTDSREDLIRWHELHGEHELAESERQHLRETRAALGLD